SKRGVSPPKGILLYGPPGCGKTLLAKACASDPRVNFISRALSNILRGEVGESEKLISQIFAEAKSSKPCVLFLDEVEALFSPHSSNQDFGRKMFVQLIQEIDGLDLDSGVFVLAATNHPLLVDSSLLRPGRIDWLLPVFPPSRMDRMELLCLLARNNNCENLDCMALSRLTAGWTGAAIVEMFRKARVFAFSDRRVGLIGVSLTLSNLQIANRRL
ncbi:P-loop containing nucleoside triphosphate hydrolase protein, partial [Zopfochytrium polystomum]